MSLKLIVMNLSFSISSPPPKMYQKNIQCFSVYVTNPQGNKPESDRVSLSY